MGALKSQCQFIVDFSSQWQFINRVIPHRRFLFGGSPVKAPWSPTYGRLFFGRGRRSPLVRDGSPNNEQYARGFPVWLKYVPGISFRTDNEPFKAAMQGFTTKIVNLMKSESLYESQGGPIILSQIENGYGPLSLKLGNPVYQYMTWAANMAVGMDTGVPWAMCKEDDAPNPVAWTGWFTEFGGPTTQRPVQDLAFAVANFIQKCLIRQPKYGHLKGLHKVVKKCEKALVSPDPIVTSLGPLQQAHVYDAGSTHSAAFLSNYDTQYATKVLTDYFS
ncbi:hypothetical protein OROHE_005153 [Orobanche hederae]